MNGMLCNALVSPVKSLAMLGSHITDYNLHYTTSLFLNLPFTAVIAHEHQMLKHIYSDSRWCIKHSLFFMEGTLAFKNFARALTATIDFSDTQQLTPALNTTSSLSAHAMNLLFKVEAAWKVVINTTKKSIISKKLDALLKTLIGDLLKLEQQISLRNNAASPEPFVNFHREFTASYHSLLAKTIEIFIPEMPGFSKFFSLSIPHISKIVESVSWSLRYFSTTLANLESVSQEEEWWVYEEYLYASEVWKSHIDDLQNILVTVHEF